MHLLFPMQEGLAIVFDGYQPTWKVGRQLLRLCTTHVVLSGSWLSVKPGALAGQPGGVLAGI
jgi:hypothetical protein